MTLLEEIAFCLVWSASWKAAEKIEDDAFGSFEEHLIRWNMSFYPHSFVSSADKILEKRAADIKNFLRDEHQARSYEREYKRLRDQIRDWKW